MCSLVSRSDQGRSLVISRVARGVLSAQGRKLGAAPIHMGNGAAVATEVAMGLAQAYGGAIRDCASIARALAS